MVLTFNSDLPLIGQQVKNKHKLIACLGASWCDTCSDWQEPFEQLAAERQQLEPNNCFVWIDIDEYPELVANFDLETLPVLLIQDHKGIYFCGAIEPRPASVKRLLQETQIKPILDPGLYEFLIEIAEGKLDQK